MSYYAVRFKSTPNVVRIEKARTPAMAFLFAFGRGDPRSDAEWKRLLIRTYLSYTKRRQAIDDPNGWTTFAEPSR